MSILVYDRQSLFQGSIATVLGRVSSDVIECKSESDLLRKIVDNPKCTIFAGLIPLQSPVLKTGEELGCTLVWIANPRDLFLPLLTQSMIHRVIYRTATVTDVGDCLIAARAGLAWIQAVPEASDDCRSVVEKFVELKPKQARITACVVQGMKNKQIAAQLGTTQQVIKNYLVDIYHQLGTNTREEVIRYFLESPLACEHASIDFRVFKM